MRSKARQQVEALRNEVEGLRTSLASMVDTLLQRVVDEIGSARREGQAAFDRQIRPALEDLRQALTLRDVELLEILKAINETQDRIAEQLEADRRERLYLREVLGLLAERIGMFDPRASSPRVIGGSVRPDLTAGSPLSLEAEERNEPPALKRTVEVRCRFGDRWAEGFEIADVIEDERGRRYRLRRISDGHIIPTSFEEHDVRIAVHER